MEPKITAVGEKEMTYLKAHWVKFSPSTIFFEDCILGMRNPHFDWIVDFGYKDTTELYIKIVLFWFVIFNLEIVHIVLWIKYHHWKIAGKMRLIYWKIARITMNGFSQSKTEKKYHGIAWRFGGFGNFRHG